MPTAENDKYPQNDGARDLAVATEVMSVPTLRSQLFRKYATLFVLAVGIALLTSGMVEVWSSYRDHTAWLISIQQAQAEAAAAKIGQFIEQIEATQPRRGKESSDQLFPDALGANC